MNAFTTLMIISIFSATVATVFAPRVNADASGDSTQVNLFAETSDGELEPIPSNVVVSQKARLRIQIHSKSATTAHVRISGKSSDAPIVAEVPLSAGETQMLPTGSAYSLAGFSDDVTVEVRLAGASTDNRRFEWHLKIPSSLSVKLTNANKVPSDPKHMPKGGALGLTQQTIASRPSLDVLEQVAMRGSAAEGITRGAAEVELFRRWAPGVVLIKTNVAEGSGSVIGVKNRIILTNAHVVGEFKTVGVIFKPKSDNDIANSQVYLADVVRVDEVTDLALIQVRELPAYVPEIQLGRNSNVEVGADTHAIGHPDGRRWSYTRGVVSQVRPGFQFQYSPGEQRQATVIQTQTPINPGNSGGPLLNDAGQLIGVNSMNGGTNAQGYTYQGINYAVSVDDARALLEMSNDRWLPRQQGENSTGAAPRVPAPGTGSDGSAQSCKPSRQSVDMNQDGAVDGYAEDVNCDGSADFISVDRNGDGQVDTVYGDLNGDGIMEVAAVDEDGNGAPDYWLVDENGDGQADAVGRDTNGDGLPDVYRKVAG